jgi:hypothetical protein
MQATVVPPQTGDRDSQSFALFPDTRRWTNVGEVTSSFCGDEADNIPKSNVPNSITLILHNHAQTYVAAARNAVGRVQGSSIRQICDNAY